MSETIQVLIVDDEPAVLLIVSRGLQKLSPQFEFDSCTSPLEALARFQHTPYQILITDYMMPDKTGLELALEAQTLVPNLQVIMMTAYSNEARHLTENLSGLTLAGFISKPFSIDKMRQIVRETAEKLTPPQ